MESRHAIEQALARLAADGFVAYPTETVWGLGASATRPVGVARLRAWKGRGADAPMSVLVASVEEATGLGCRLEAPARRLIESFWPGPLTLIVPCDRRFAPGIARDDGALGLRCSSHPVAYALSAAAAEAGVGPLTSTSFNRSGEAPAENIDAARALMRHGDEADLGSPGLVWVEGQDAGGGAPSSVVDCTGARPVVVRSGAVEPSALERAWLPAASRPDQP